MSTALRNLPGLPFLQLLDRVDRFVLVDRRVVAPAEQQHVLKRVQRLLRVGRIVARSSFAPRSDVRDIHDDGQPASIPKHQFAGAAGICTRRRAAEQELDCLQTARVGHDTKLPIGADNLVVDRVRRALARHCPLARPLPPSGAQPRPPWLQRPERPRWSRPARTSHAAQCSCTPTSASSRACVRRGRSADRRARLLRPDVQQQAGGVALIRAHLDTGVT